MNKKTYRLIHKNDLNNYELENKRLSYANLLYKDEPLLLCNNIANDFDNLELVGGIDYIENEDGDIIEYIDIYQYYLIREDTARRLIEDTNEIIYYHNELDIYILGVSHFGTGWDYVLTDIKLKKAYEDNNDWYCAYIDTVDDYGI